VTNFEFFRFRFHFQALDPIHFPAGKSGNIIRGALGMILRDTSPRAYRHLFAPGNGSAPAPSGLADWPRPFVLRASLLDSSTVPPGGLFAFDVHVFDLRAPALDYFRHAFAQFGSQGIGPGHGRARLEQVQQINLQDRAEPDTGGPALAVDLAPDLTAPSCVPVRFLTPTELKYGGALARRPEFPALFGRLRDRISTLRMLYGAGPLDLDFCGMGERAETIRLSHCELKWETVARKSGRTGQVHPLGGFTGEARYEGDLAEFLPWLRAARWVGVGRQTVWGKGDVRVMDPEAR
jgi:hypothetical protein